MILVGIDVAKNKHDCFIMTLLKYIIIYFSKNKKRNKKEPDN